MINPSPDRPAPRDLPAGAAWKQLGSFALLLGAIFSIMDVATQSRLTPTTEDTLFVALLLGAGAALVVIGQARAKKLI